MFLTLLYWLLLLLLSSCIPFHEHVSASTSCGRAIDDEHEARECFNLQINQADMPPLPVTLESTVESGYICGNTKPLYTFSCRAHAFDLIWYINEERVTAFLPFDPIGTIFTSSYPFSSAPVYNITAILVQQTLVSVGGKKLRLATSTLIVQPFNESQFEVIPFTVSCQAHCEDGNYTEVCQSKQVNIAAKPTKPNKVYGSVHVAANVSLSLLNWDSPQNQNETVIDYYDITLLRNHSNCTNDSIRVAASRQTLSYTYAALDGNCTSATITAVDLCGQRSDTSELQLISVTNTNVDPNDRQKSQRTVDILAGVLAVVLAMIIVLCIIFVAIKICQHMNSMSQYDVECDSRCQPV